MDFHYCAAFQGDALPPRAVQLISITCTKRTPSTTSILPNLSRRPRSLCFHLQPCIHRTKMSIAQPTRSPPHGTKLPAIAPPSLLLRLSACSAIVFVGVPGQAIGADLHLVVPSGRPENRGETKKGFLSNS